MAAKRPRNTVDQLTRELRLFIAGVILFNERVATALGLNGTDLQCLHLLDLQGSMTPTELAKWTGLSTGGVTVALDRLEHNGYIRRERNPEDRRSSIVSPAVGLRARKLRERYQDMGEVVTRVLSQYSERELQLILKFFRDTNAAGAVASRK
jgi:DNA-binding MarR family transcriptional regulator